MTFSGKDFLASADEAVHPLRHGGLGAVEEALPLLRLELAGEGDGRELRGVQDLVGVGVAHAADEARIGEGALEGAVFLGEGGAEACEIGGEDLDAAGIDRAQALFAAHYVEGGAALAAGFGKGEGSAGEVEGGEGVAAGEFGLGGLPVEASGDHEVEYQPEIAFDTDGDALADAADGDDFLAFDGAERGIDGAEQEDRAQADVLEGLAEDAGFDGGEVGGDVGEFRHGVGRITAELSAFS